MWNLSRFLSFISIWTCFNVGWLFRTIAEKTHSFPERLTRHSRIILSFRKLPQVVPWALTAQTKPGGSCCRSPLEERASCSVTMTWLSFDGEINSFHNHIILVALCSEFTQTWKKWKLIEKEKKILPLASPWNLEKWWDRFKGLLPAGAGIYFFAILDIENQKKAIGLWGRDRYRKRV